MVNYELTGILLTVVIQALYIAFKIGKFEEKITSLELKQDKHNNIIERVFHLEESNKTAHKRIDAIEKLTNSVYELASSIKAMQVDLSDISQRIRLVEETPKKRWDLVCTTVISALVGYLVKGMFM